MGRPTKLTAETSQTILDVIAAGGTRAVAAQAAGIHPDTIYDWMRRGAEDAKTSASGSPSARCSLRAFTVSRRAVRGFPDG